MMKLIDFSNNWKNYFTKEKELLLNALEGHPVLEVEHIGATSVVLCKTCGTIDLLCSIQSSVEFFSYKNILTRRGYQFINSLSNNDCFVFVRRNEKKQIVSLIRLVEHASETYKKIILFKYYLKEKTAHVMAYNQFRETLLAQVGDDAKKYQQIKANYIESILAEFCEIK